NGHTLTTLYSRNKKEGEALAKKFGDIRFTQQLDFSNADAEFFIIAVRDNAIEEISSRMTLPPEAILIHTSGSVSIESLSNHKHYGVFYPLQTFTKGKPLQSPIFPIGIEGSDNEIENKLLTLAKTISPNVQLLSSEKRKAIHIAAVFA